MGRQEPTLIFDHGFACALDDRDRQVEALSPRFRCVALDLTMPWMDAVASSLPTSEAKIIHDVGHFAMIEDALPVNDAIEKFAARLV